MVRTSALLDSSLVLHRPQDQDIPTRLRAPATMYGDAEQTRRAAGTACPWPHKASLCVAVTARPMSLVGDNPDDNPDEHQRTDDSSN
jgi:hypothetical protein